MRRLSTRPLVVLMGGAEDAADDAADVADAGGDLGGGLAEVVACGDGSAVDDGLGDVGGGRPGNGAGSPLSPQVIVSVSAEALGSTGTQDKVSVVASVPVAAGPTAQSS
jgi:hypothetical protein